MKNEKIGLVTKKMASKFWVEVDGNLVFCTAKKNLKTVGVFVGDNVKVNISELNIIDVVKRKNKLVRPQMANLDQLFICVSDQPEIDFLMLDKMLVFCHVNGIEPVICFTKNDNSDMLFSIIKKDYHKHYKIISTSAEKKVNIDEIKKLLTGKISAFAGQSGVGKSALINALFENDFAVVGGLSEKIGRGKNTTRHIELYKIFDGSYIADTPGFSALEEAYLTINETELTRYYPDFLEYMSLCKFNSCVHINEQICGVKNAVKNGLISPQRYQRYLTIYNGLKDARKF